MLFNDSRMQERSTSPSMGHQSSVGRANIMANNIISSCGQLGIFGLSGHAGSLLLVPVSGIRSSGWSLDGELLQPRELRRRGVPTIQRSHCVSSSGDGRAGGGGEGTTMGGASRKRQRRGGKGRAQRQQPSCFLAVALIMLVPGAVTRRRRYHNPLLGSKQRVSALPADLPRRPCSRSTDLSRLATSAHQPEEGHETFNPAKAARKVKALTQQLPSEITATADSCVLVISVCLCVLCVCVHGAGHRVPGGHGSDERTPQVGGCRRGRS